MRLPTVERVVTLALVLLVAPLAATAQPPSKVWTIGLLGGPAGRWDVFEEGLRALGYVEGRNVRFVRRFSLQYEEYARLAADLVRFQVDVIVAGNAPSIQAAQSATRTTPIVMAMTGDPVGAGFVASLARPGGNITGLSIMHPELSGKRLEILTELIPGARRMAMLTNPANPSTPAMVRETEATAHALGVRLLRVDATTPDQIIPMLEAAGRERPDALVVLGDPMFSTHRQRLIDWAAKHRLPAIYEGRNFTEAGGLASYGTRSEDFYRRAATYVDKILQGVKPADLPIEQPMKFELVLNLKTAQVLGLTIPPTLLLQADKVIK